MANATNPIRLAPVVPVASNPGANGPGGGGGGDPRPRTCVPFLSPCLFLFLRRASAIPSHLAVWLAELGSVMKVVPLTLPCLLFQNWLSSIPSSTHSLVCPRRLPCLLPSTACCRQLLAAVLAIHIQPSTRQIDKAGCLQTDPKASPLAYPHRKLPSLKKTILSRIPLAQ